MKNKKTQEKYSLTERHGQLVMTHEYLCGIHSNRPLEDACRKRIDFMWLLEDEPVPDYSTFSRFGKRCGEEIEELFYQFVRSLEDAGEADHDAVFKDGTKMESRAGRYTFCWRGNVEKQLAKVKAKVKDEFGCATLRQGKKKACTPGCHLVFNI